MADTTFVNGVTLTDADWFNDVNRLQYTILGDPADAAAVRTALSLTSASQAEMEAGTEAGLRAMSPLRVAQAIAALGIGAVVQVVEATPYTTYSSTASTIPFDDTIPQDSEGAEWNSVSITPTSATNRLRIEVEYSMITSGGGENVTAALFKSGTASALAATSKLLTGAWQSSLNFSYEMAAGTTSAVTFTTRAGMATTTLYINGNSGGRKLGGVAAVRMRVTEIKV